MQSRYRPRKQSNPQPFRQRDLKLPVLRRTRRRDLFLAVGCFVIFLWFWTRPRVETPYRPYVPTGNPSVVIVTVLHPKSAGSEYLAGIRKNRVEYAERHGYKTFIPYAWDYELDGAPSSWSHVMAMRHALTTYPDCAYLWFLDQDALIMAPSIALDDHILAPRVLQENMIRNVSVVPPDSIVRTFAHMEVKDAELIISQDSTGLVSNSLILKNGEYARFLLETWFNPLYRSYNFQKAERHALVCFSHSYLFDPRNLTLDSYHSTASVVELTVSKEHIVQWHPTVLSKLALVSQHFLASYSDMAYGAEYQRGDLVVVFNECPESDGQNCAVVAQPYHEVLSSLTET